MANKTKVFYGNQYIGGMTIDGSKACKASKFQMFVNETNRKALKFLKFTTLMLVIYGATLSGMSYEKVNGVPKIVEAQVKVPIEKTLADYPILMKICKAESGMKQFNKNGDVTRNPTTPSDIGICQIHETIWNDQARKLGYDIYTEKGNEDMAMWIFTHYGTDPWNSSKQIVNGWGK